MGTLVYFIPNKAKDPPWYAVQVGSVASTVAAKIVFFPNPQKFFNYFINEQLKLGTTADDTGFDSQ